jgi:hypothetical protein
MAHVIDLLTRLLSDEGAQAAFDEDPVSYLLANSQGDMAGEDVVEALPLVRQRLSEEQASALESPRGRPQVSPIGAESEVDAAVRQISFAIQVVRSGGQSGDDGAGDVVVDAPVQGWQQDWQQHEDRPDQLDASRPWGDQGEQAEHRWDEPAEAGLGQGWDFAGRDVDHSGAEEEFADGLAGAGDEADVVGGDEQQWDKPFEGAIEYGDHQDGW